MAAKTAQDVLKLAKEKKVRFIRLWFTDVLGFLKSFAITLPELEKVSSSQLDAQCVQAFIAFWQDRREKESAKTEALAQAGTD